MRSSNSCKITLVASHNILTSAKMVRETLLLNTIRCQKNLRSKKKNRRKALKTENPVKITLAERKLRLSFTNAEMKQGKQSRTKW